MRRLTFEGKIIVFKTLAISKIFHFSISKISLSLIPKVSTEIISKLYERIDQCTFSTN